MTRLASTLTLAWALTSVVVGTAACSDSDSGTGGNAATSGGESGGGSPSSTSGTGGTGGAGGAAPESVLGTTPDGEGTTAQSFADACVAEGGVLGDSCQNAVCGGSGWQATCYEPAEPSADEFSCDGLFNCKVGEVCSAREPQPDGCFSHACESFPAACADDPTCACLLAESDFAFEECEEDADGNPTFRSEAL